MLDVLAANTPSLVLKCFIVGGSLQDYAFATRSCSTSIFCIQMQYRLPWRCTRRTVCVSADSASCENDPRPFTTPGLKQQYLCSSSGENHSSSVTVTSGTNPATISALSASYALRLTLVPATRTAFANCVSTPSLVIGKHSGPGLPPMSSRWRGTVRLATAIRNVLSKSYTVRF